MLKLIPEWRKAGRMLSVQCMALGAAIQGAYSALPAEMLAVVPAQVIHYAVLALFFSGIVGRLIDQPKVRKPKDTANAE